MQRKRWGQPRRGRWERGGAGAGPGAGLATAPPCCVFPAVPRGRRWLGLRSPFVYDSLAGRSADPAQRRLRGVPPPRPGPGRPLLLFLRSSLLRAPAPSLELQPLGRERPRVLPRTLPRPARGVHPPHSRPVPLFIPPPIPGLQGGENKLKAEQLRDSNKTPRT